MTSTETQLIEEARISPLRPRDLVTATRWNTARTLTVKGVFRWFDGAYRLNAAPKLEVVS